MPLFYQHNINGDTKLGIWRIGEPESFFLEKVPLKREVSHPSKRLQHLAGRYLLPLLFPDFPLAEILIADTRKPFLESEKYHFSISHCGAYAAVLVSATHRVGVDIESITPRIRGLAHKFVHEDEAPFLDGSGIKDQDALLTLVWSAKESIFKWYGRGEMDFRRDMRLHGKIGRDAAEGGWLDMPFVFRKEGEAALEVKARIFEQLGLVLTYVVT